MNGALTLEGGKSKKNNFMIGLFWNCRGESNKGMSVMIRDILVNNMVDFMGLQETMKKKYFEA